MSTSPEDKDENMSEDDYLNKYLNDTSNNSNQQVNNNISSIPEDAQQYDTGRATDLQFFSFDAKNFPLGKFYPEGTQILVRAAQVMEIQAYSMVENDNFYDVVAKMNDMISNKIK